MKFFILKISILSLSLMMVVFSCGNNDKITLEYNLKQGELYKQNAVMNMDLVMKIMEQEMKISFVMDMKMTCEVKESQKDSYTMEMKYKEFKIEGGIPGMANFAFDSNTTEGVTTPENFSPMLKAVIDKPIEFVMDKIGKVKSIKGIEAFHDAMLNSFDESIPEELRQQLITQFGSQFSEQSFKSMIEQNSGCFPNKPVTIGDNWNNKLSMTASNFAIDVDMKMTLKSIEDNVITIDMDGTVSTPKEYEQEINGIKAKMDMKGTQKGVMKLNRDTGWVISSDIMQNFNGDMEVNGIKMPVYAASKIMLSSD
jgi:hypothetical protein